MHKTISLSCLIFISACASVETRLPNVDPSAFAKETAIQESQAFTRYTDMLARLDRVSARILKANAQLCEKTRTDIGARTHISKSYSKHVRQAAVRQLDAKKMPSVLMVRPNSPAQRVGLTKGDVLLNQNNKPVSENAKNIMGNDGQFKIRRNGKIMTLTAKPETICDYKVNLRMSGAVNAYATGRSIIVTTAMIDFAKTDEELALVIGHELAHNTMGHISKVIRNVILSGFATRTTRPFEAEADYVGLYYMARAGYDFKDVELFWRRLGVQHPKAILREKTHPMTPSRLLSIRSTADEIRAKQSTGKTLRPNYINPQ